MKSRRSSRVSRSENRDSEKQSNGAVMDRVVDDTRSQSVVNSSEHSVVCVGCENAFPDYDKLVQCDRCDGWSCQACSRLSDEQWKCNVLSKPCVPMTFFALSAKPQALKEVKMGNVIDEKCRAMQQQIDALKEELNTTSTTVLGLTMSSEKGGKM